MGGAGDRGFREALYEWARHTPVMREGGELPRWEEPEGGAMAMLLEARTREWKAQLLQEGIERGRAEGRAEGRS